MTWPPDGRRCRAENRFGGRCGSWAREDGRCPMHEDAPLDRCPICKTTLRGPDHFHLVTHLVANHGWRVHVSRNGGGGPRG